MSKNINIVLQNMNVDLVGFENVVIDQIASVYSFSCDIINCSIASFFEHSKFWMIMEILIDKLKPGGQLAISIYDTQRIAALYTNNQIQSSDYLGLMKNINNCISLSDFMEFSSNKKDIVIADIKKDQLITNITIIKNQITNG
jgi:hypothetical protein